MINFWHEIQLIRSLNLAAYGIGLALSLDTMKNIRICLFSLLALALFSQSALAGPSSCYPIVKKPAYPWASKAIDKIREIRNLPPPPAPPSIQEVICKPVEVSFDIKDADHYEKRCSGTGQYAQFVADSQKALKDDKNPQGCRGISARVLELQKRLAQINCSGSELVTIHQAAAQLTYELSLKLNQNDILESKAWSAIAGGGHFASGGLPCRQLRYGLSNHHFDIDRQAVEELLKESRQIITDVEMFAGQN